jgi:hypothetical protein
MTLGDSACFSSGVLLYFHITLTSCSSCWYVLAAPAGASGVLLALRDLAYVARAYCVTLCSLWLFIWVGASRPGWGLEGVWAGLVLFFALRCCQSLGRLLWLGAGRDKGMGLDGVSAA